MSAPKDFSKAGVTIPPFFLLTLLSPCTLELSMVVNSDLFKILCSTLKIVLFGEEKINNFSTSLRFSRNMTL